MGFYSLVKFALTTTPTPTAGIEQLMTDLSAFVTGIIGWVGEAAAEIVQTPLLMFTMGFLAIGGAIGILGRLIRR